MNRLKYIKVTQMESSRSGRPVPNQFIVTCPEGQYFQSYNSVIAFVANDGATILDEYKWDYSATTNKYRSQFLGEDTPTTRKKISAGLYQTGELNG